MLDWIFSTPRHAAIFTLFCAAWWAGTGAFAWFRGRFSFGWAGRVERERNPRTFAFWIALCLAIAVSLCVSGVAGLVS
jgi:hypothetical protein